MVFSEVANEMHNWVTLILAIVVVGSAAFGVARGFAREFSRSIWQLISIAISAVSIGIAWIGSQRASHLVLHAKTAGLPHAVANVLNAWQTHQRIGNWIAFLVCEIILSSVLSQILSALFRTIRVPFSHTIRDSRLLGGLLGAVMGGIRAGVIGAILFVVTQYISVPVLSTMTHSSKPYQLLATKVYRPWLKPLVAKELPVLEQGALQPIAANISVFAIPTGSNGRETGVLVVPKPVAALSHRITAGITSPMAKAKALYEWEIHHISYNWQKYDDYVYHHHWDAQTPLQTLQTGKGVCADYALLYADMAHAAGLDVRIQEGLGGTASNYGSHAWNEVYVPNQHAWINVDTTWGASEDSWFNVPSSTFKQTHIAQKTITVYAATRA